MAPLGLAFVGVGDVAQRDYLLERLGRPGRAVVRYPRPRDPARRQRAGVARFGRGPTAPAWRRRSGGHARLTAHPRGPGQLVLALLAATDSYFAEAVESMARTGAHVVVAPEAGRASELGSLSLFAAPLALGMLLARQRGLDPDCPKWFDEYAAVARVVPVPAHQVIGDLSSQVPLEQRTESHAADQSRSRP